MQFFKASMLLCTALFLTTGIDAKTTSKNQLNIASTKEPTPLPKLFIKSIKNVTPYNLLLVDRLANPKESECAWRLPAGKITTLNLQVNTANAIVLNGSLAEIMENDAQYIFIKLDKNGLEMPEHEVFFNLHLTESVGAARLHFNVAGKQGGCRMYSNLLKNPACKQAEFELVVELDESGFKNGQFRLNIGGTLDEQ